MFFCIEAFDSEKEKINRTEDTQVASIHLAKPQPKETNPTPNLIRNEPSKIRNASMLERHIIRPARMTRGHHTSGDRDTSPTPHLICFANRTAVAPNLVVSNMGNKGHLTKNAGVSVLRSPKRYRVQNLVSSKEHTRSAR